MDRNVFPFMLFSCVFRVNNTQNFKRQIMGFNSHKQSVVLILNFEATYSKDV
jgi:hypothetical protein